LLGLARRRMVLDGGEGRAVMEGGCAKDVVVVDSGEDVESMLETLNGAALHAGVSR